MRHSFSNTSHFGGVAQYIGVLPCHRVATVLEIREIRERSGKMKKIEKVRETPGNLMKQD